MKKVALFLLVMSMVISVRCAYAIPIYADITNSESGLGNFVAELTYLNKQLTVEIENKSQAVNGGYLLGFSFNNPGGLITDVTKGATWSDADFSIVGGTAFDNGLNESPYGAFDIGAEVILGKNGSPSDGIAVGVKETFVFNLTTSSDSLTADDFIAALSYQKVEHKEGEFFFARFQGFNDKGSDKVPGTTTEENPVPEPMTMLLLGPALLGLLGFKRKKA